MVRRFKNAEGYAVLLPSGLIPLFLKRKCWIWRLRRLIGARPQRCGEVLRSLESILEESRIDFHSSISSALRQRLYDPANDGTL